MKPTKRGPIILYSDAATGANNWAESSFSSEEEEKEAALDDFEVLDSGSKDPTYKPGDDLPSEEIEPVQKQ